LTGSALADGRGPRPNPGDENPVGADLIGRGPNRRWMKVQWHVWTASAWQLTLALMRSGDRVPIQVIALILRCSPLIGFSRSRLDPFVITSLCTSPIWFDTRRLLVIGAVLR